MGGTKKKPMAKAEKSQAREEVAKPAKKSKEEKRAQLVREAAGVIARFEPEKVLPKLAELKAITLYPAARALGVRASVAESVLRSLESKGLVRRAGGWSGHYIYTVAPEALAKIAAPVRS